MLLVRTHTPPGRDGLMNLSPDPSFNFNLLRWIGTAPYRGADIAEVLDLAGRLVPVHSRPGASVLMNGVALDWLSKTMAPSSGRAR